MHLAQIFMYDPKSNNCKDNLNFKGRSVSLPLLVTDFSLLSNNSNFNRSLNYFFQLRYCLNLSKPPTHILFFHNYKLTATY